MCATRSPIFLALFFFSIFDSLFKLLHLYVSSGNLFDETIYFVHASSQNISNFSHRRRYVTVSNYDGRLFAFLMDFRFFVWCLRMPKPSPWIFEWIFQALCDSRSCARLRIPGSSTSAWLVLAFEYGSEYFKNVQDRREGGYQSYLWSCI
jgi:hypothetical protein